jgi:hypothetical protein
MIRNLAFCIRLAIGVGCLSAGLCYGANPAAGLWVGEITLNSVNETVGGVNAANQMVFQDPTNATLVAFPAHLRVIFHVSSNGTVRLLRSVAVIPKPGTNTVPDVALVTDASLYSSFTNGGVGKRITAVAFDFGDANAAQIVNQVAEAAATAAANGGNPANAANAVVAGAATNTPPYATPGYTQFIASSSFQSSAAIAAAAAASAAQAAAGGTVSAIQYAANNAALGALAKAGVTAAADKVLANETVMNGSFGPGGILTGMIFLGANHPTNPFRHRQHPDHKVGFSISRGITVAFDTGNGTNLQTAGLGVDHITGTYHEEISGLHKPLGPSQNIGLITEGVISLDHISPVATLNQ